MDPGAIGRPPVLPPNIEEKLVDTVKKAADMGFGLSRKQLFSKTGQLVKSLNLKTPFKKGIPGKDWFVGLKGRHPDFVVKKPQKLSVTRAKAMNKKVVDEYFDQLESVINELKVGPKQIWNCDESNIQLEHKPSNVVGRKGAKIPGRTANSKESVSVLGCGNASGNIMSPMIIVKGKTKRSLMSWKIEDAPANTKWAYQEKSYMDQTLGVEWFESVFLKECGHERPQLLILDSHCSHEPLELLECAKKENITLLSLPSHCTHDLQPWDKSMFGPLKKKYNSICSKFMSESLQHIITKQTWPGIFAKAWNAAITSTNMVSGFAATGIYPFNPSAISAQSFAPSIVATKEYTEPNCTTEQSNIVTTIADIHVPPSEKPSIVDADEEGCILEFPVISDNGQEMLSLPVSFDNNIEIVYSQDIPDLANATLEEITPSPYWNADCEAMFLPENKSNTVATKQRKTSYATMSRILTSSEIINEKREKEELKIKKAKAAEERKIKAEERKLAKMLKLAKKE